jgi:transcriptional regulator with PAS, ATPase and Fis domain
VASKGGTRVQNSAARKTTSEQLDLFPPPAPDAENGRAACHFDDIIGRSSRMVAIFDLIERVADCDSTILINGETGTGKGLVARAIHRKSRRHNQPFISINCGAIPKICWKASCSAM